MRRSRKYPYAIVIIAVAVLLIAGQASRLAFSQSPRVASIPGINPGPCNPGPEEKPWLNANQTPGCRALEAIASMSLDEKLAELGGITGNSRNQRLGLIAGGGSDGPNGIATMNGPAAGRSRNVTVFAQAVTLAATWDRELAAMQGKYIGEEFNGKGMNSVLGPTINIIRTWHWGRNGETMSEDPYLTAEMAVPEIKGLNEQKVLTVLKHFAANNQENTRCGIAPDMAGIDARVSEKALQEIYFPAFKAAVQRAGTGGIMCSYNQVNGTFACNNGELLNHLREWGYDGFIAPDAGYALRDPLVAALAGTTRPGGPQLRQYLDQEKLKVSDIDRMLYYNLTPYFRIGIFDNPSKGNANAEVSTPQHKEFARKVAEEGAVLLKNKLATLPIDAAKVKTIAVIGDDAGPNVVISLNGSGRVAPTEGTVSNPLDAIKARAGDKVKIVYEKGTAGIGPLPAIPVNLLKPETGTGEGLLASYFSTENSTGVPVVARVEPGVRSVANPPAEWYTALGMPVPAARGRGGAPGAGGPPAGAPGAGAPPQGGAQAGAPGGRGTGAPAAGGQGAQAGRGAGAPGGGGGMGMMAPRRAWSSSWTGFLTPPTAGTYLFSVTGAGTAQLYIDHKLVTTMMRADFAQTVVGAINLKPGRSVPVELKYSSSSVIMSPGISLGWQPPDSGLLEKAVAAAKTADMAIVFASEQMGEGQDKITLPLPGDQDALIQAVAKVNPKTVVVLHTSNPVSMPWLNDVAAVVEAFYPGQEAGNAIARVLFGDVNPSGKLAMTFPANEYQGPGSTFLEYPGDGMSVNLDEGHNVGYRFYDVRNQTPLFPFGFGLSYTTFRYSDLVVEHAGNGAAAVKARVTNAGSREGAEVVQLYIGMPAAADEAPRQLKGFDKIRLKPGESKVVTMKLDKDLLSAFDADTRSWKLFPGVYSVMVGASSRDIRLKGSFTVN